MRKIFKSALIICLTAGLAAGCSSVSEKDYSAVPSVIAPTYLPAAAADPTDYGTDVNEVSPVQYPAGNEGAGEDAPAGETGKNDGNPAAKDEGGDTATTGEAGSDPVSVTEPAATSTPTPTPVVYHGSLDVPEGITDPVEKIEFIRSGLIANAAYYDSLDNYNDSTWCFKRMKDHTQSGSYESFRIADYNACYVDTDVTDDDKVIYLTFDCGYPSDLTEKILDTLAAHNAKANFFVTKMYLEKCGDYAKRMKEEGHAVCNHTVSHTDLTNMSVEKIAAEILDVAEYFYQITGYEFDPYLRTPTGAYTKRLLTIISDAGYKTVFWSIAYGDYDNNNQPAPGYVLDHFTTYHHNGAIALMHNDSTSNANELDAVLTMLENEGYRFALLNELDD